LEKTEAVRLIPRRRLALAVQNQIALGDEMATSFRHSSLKNLIDKYGYGSPCVPHHGFRSRPADLSIEELLSLLFILEANAPRPGYRSFKDQQ